PTKLEGNPGHPASLGASDALTQASILTLYDPDRSQTVTHMETISTWPEFLRALDAQKGDRLRILTGTVTSPSLENQLRGLLARFPHAVWHQYEPLNDDAPREGALTAFGRDVSIQYRFDRADVILALDADFLLNGPASVRYAGDFARRRGAEGMNRLYVVESTPTVTGAMADHRYRVQAGAVEGIAREIARAVSAGTPSAAVASPDEAWTGPVARDLLAHRGRSVVVAGPYQSAALHALVHMINDALGNAGRTVFYTDPVAFRDTGQMESFRSLVAAMEAGEVETLLVAGCNPAYDAPADSGFARHIGRVNMKIHTGLYSDETSALCDWHIPGTHYLEQWSDARAYDGTVTIVQPLIAPLYDGKSVHEVVAAIAGDAPAKGYDIVRRYWMGLRPGPEFESFWRKSLNDGVVEGTALPLIDVRPVPGRDLPEGPAGDGAAAPADDGSLEIVFRPDPTIWDGQFANNGWLQELPKPVTRLTWDNAAMIGPALAERLGLSSEQVVDLEFRGRSLRCPVLVLPGQAEDVVTLHLGYGRSHAGKVGSGTGVNAYLLRTADALWFGKGLTVRKTDRRYPLAVTQTHQAMEGRGQVRSATLQEFLRNPSFAREGPPGGSLYPRHEYREHAWGMSIDLNACIGCNACVAACQAENNIPVVGKEQVRDSREMHWIRIDTYMAGPPADPAMFFQPVPCMHCEDAPCELVCPVGATVHDSEGLNVMVYNRCIGTRYCSNNRPYKVRRFNFLQYVDDDSPTLKMQRNPDVTVRSRGVMEKCSYCLQRINAARITSEKEGRNIRDGEIVTACQGACPAHAIVFGDINDPASSVAKLKSGPRDYPLLGELNTRPRTTYLAKLTNPFTGESPDADQ
ncbi:MAG TPA: 4Fe-4S dicluster domain-containing protein, partial [Bacteroidota bacterium]|nr:4Fe-4S dicluster domain-containing protein [Bacteroidota bacterium]